MADDKLYRRKYMRVAKFGRILRFQDRLKLIPSSEHPSCIEWDGRLYDGYGRMGGELAHRVSYELFVGPIPDGLEIDHICVNRACVNPEHLEAVPSYVNSRRCYRTKLSPEIVAEIRNSKESSRFLGRKFGVNKTAILAVRHKLNWRDYGGR